MKSYKKTLALHTLVQLWPWLKPHKRLVVTGAVMIPIVSLISMIQPLAVQRAIDQGILKGDLPTTLKWASITLGLAFSSYIFSAVQSLTSATAVHRMILSLRTSLVRHVLNLSSSWHDGQISGALATRATSDFDTLSDSLNQGVLSSVIDIMVLVGCIVGMFILSVKLALTAIVILPIMTWVVLWFSKKLNDSMLSSRKNLAELNGFTQEALASMDAVKLLNAQSGVSRRYRSLSQAYRDAQLENVFYDSLMFSTIDGISSITLGVALFIAIKSTGLGSDLTAGIMVAFVQYIQQLFEPLKQLGTKMAMLQGAFTSIERIFGLLDRKDHVKGDQNVHWNKSVSVEFEDVSFSYNQHPTPILKKVSFKVPPSTSLAIIGRTGSGKSTIIKLLTKLYDGYQGSIKIDGAALAPFHPESVRSTMGIVPQDIVLFEGTIEFNIGLGHAQMTPEQIRRAARVVGAEDFIQQLPGGYNFQIREGGSNLSHGQKQLLVFARALVHEPPILVLDEATSSVDPASEALIQNSIEKLLQYRTVIVIAHRLETVKKCHQILVLEHGQVVEQGTWDELMNQKRKFFDLAKNSHKQEAVSVIS